MIVIPKRSFQLRKGVVAYRGIEVEVSEEEYKRFRSSLLTQEEASVRPVGANAYDVLPFNDVKHVRPKMIRRKQK